MPHTQKSPQPLASTPIKLLLAALSLLLTHPAHTQSPAEQTLLRLANQSRATQNLPPLQWNPALAKAAQTHLQRMLQTPATLQHQYPGEPDLATRGAQAGAHFSTIAENLGGQAPNPADLHQVWMTSPTHRANLLDPNLNSVGISVHPGNDGLLYAVQDFARITPPAGNNTVVKQIAQLLQSRGIAPAPTNQDAQQTCEMPKGATGDAKMVIQWDGPNPTQLPDVLLKEIDTGRYTSAQVGVCPGNQPANQQFTTYHVAVLLY
jgi:uncharacterized protein YkwD